jgi:hypothetical protein
MQLNYKKEATFTGWLLFSMKEKKVLIHKKFQNIVKLLFVLLSEKGY